MKQKSILALAIIAFLLFVGIVHGWGLAVLCYLAIATLLSPARTQRLYALAYVNLTGYKRGVTSAEVGINCSRFSIEIEPEINDWLNGIDGQATGKAVGDPMAKLTIEGEINAATGVMAAVVATAFVPANTVTYFGRSAGGFYFARGVVDQERDGWKKLTADFESRFNVP